MKTLLIFCICLACSIAAAAQNMQGAIFDKDSKTPLEDVSVINRRTGHIVNSDKDGRFYIQCSYGDTILFYMSSYKPIALLMPFSAGVIYKTILMPPLNYKLKEATVTNLSKYELDSAIMRETFQHSIDYNQPSKPRMVYNGGIGVSGLFSSAAERISGQRKKKQRFLNTFNTDEENRFIATRYTPALVSEMTGMKGDSVTQFMNSHPMEYDYARNAPDLELKMWIRNNYKQWLHK